ncbi:hypothetical protein EON65_25955 [archaeon]|nr:MAG: hypothetical protein EON65_25955 [archaeon]
MFLLTVSLSFTYSLDGAWHHRLWIVDRFVIDYESELSLCKEFLTADQRNFHCWNYRRAVFQRSGLQPSSELDFCLDKIQENFSNYSAFHHRSIYIKYAEMSMQEIFDSEWPLIENAVYTEPDDQSAWWYYQFLVTLAHGHIADAEDAQEYVQWLQSVLTRHMEVLLGLIEVEETSRWPHMILVFLIDMLLSPQCRPVLNEEEIGKLTEDREKYLVKLIELDPIHEQRYRFLLDHNAAV